MSKDRLKKAEVKTKAKPKAPSDRKSIMKNRKAQPYKKNAKY